MVNRSASLSSAQNLTNGVMSRVVPLPRQCFGKVKRSTDAFLCQKEYLEALLVCLQAVEQNHAALLAEIDPSILLVVKRSQSDGIMIRSAARGDPLTPPLLPSPKTPSTIAPCMVHADVVSCSASPDGSASESLRHVLKSGDYDTEGLLPLPVPPKDPLLSMHVVPGVPTGTAMHALNGLTTAHLNRLQENKKLYTLKPKPSSARDSILNSDSCDSKSCDNRTLAQTGRSLSQVQLSSSSVKSPSPCDQIDSSRRKTHKRSVSDVTDYKAPIILDQTSPLHVNHAPCDPFFQKPQPDQSLISFLQAQDFSTCAELDRENAHFMMCEATLEALAIVEWRKSNQGSESEEEEEEDDHQRMCIRRRKHSDYADSSSNGGEGSSDGSDVHDTEVNAASPDTNLTGLKESGLSLSMASLYSDAELKRSASMSNNVIVPRDNAFEVSGVYMLPSSMHPESSAVRTAPENIAISLLRLVPESLLPTAAELDWVSLDEDSANDTRLRGNLLWAPPRPQIIFNVHQRPKMDKLLSSQNHRCAGCGGKIDTNNLKRYRFCYYYGKLFCACCHSNKENYIPGLILRNWDFRRQRVANFSNDLIKRIMQEPLFNVHDINPGLYKRVKSLSELRYLRVALRHARPFLITCRKTAKLLSRVDSLGSYWLQDPNVFTLQDLIKVKTEKLADTVYRIYKDCWQHITACPLCRAKGFVCETCNNGEDIIFPFEFDRVKQCNGCHGCFHRRCYVADRCPKCSRVEARRKQREKEALVEVEEGEEEEESTSR
ncbi:hypothetical protein CAPTEDRAFT_226105 [Capitella teleta]|uniref:Rubicon Homology domain-containing protein n=1 Tax=Capitella teleta TaxID=283909 RepID=R7UXJ2_CAPTE|nr:hypothetical protein CAPTEDRAFT_226105 [Capitella teleta]|eukprot:ELU11303.1 hypothetical protein CAPTEDRAFT_226105 [Capitella teleta]